MATQTTHGIKISIFPKYEKDYSDKAKEQSIFSYRVLIENNSTMTVQLLRRTWHIFDSYNEKRTVEGEGVIGEQPILQPGQIYEYASWCPLMSDLGSMTGSYLMMELESGKQFNVDIPEFQLMADFRQN
ncbi:MAG: Co2+/Mg2+ efflux protein ApaG [Saprospiraceae bacterium]|nr:Co2+/Mg2+ efflux protein ApaG [Saprospiraceae bacterium]